MSISNTLAPFYPMRAIHFDQVVISISIRCPICRWKLFHWDKIFYSLSEFDMHHNGDREMLLPSAKCQFHFSYWRETSNDAIFSRNKWSNVAFAFLCFPLNLHTQKRSKSGIIRWNGFVLFTYRNSQKISNELWNLHSHFHSYISIHSTQPEKKSRRLVEVAITVNSYPKNGNKFPFAKFNCVLSIRVFCDTHSSGFSINCQRERMPNTEREQYWRTSLVLSRICTHSHRQPKSVHLMRKCDLRYLIGSPTANTFRSLAYTLKHHQ